LSLQNGQPFEMIFPLRGIDNVFRPFLTRVIPIRNRNGEIIRWLGTGTDITSQKELERMKDDFIAIASHELKTPVTIIKVCAQVLGQLFKNNSDTVATDWIGTINEQVNKLIALIEDMLDATRFQTGKMQLEKASFDMNELVIQIVAKIQESSPNHLIEVDLQKNINMCCDRESLGRVISNLLTNAIKYSPNSNKVILRTKVNKSDIVLSVRDFGLGIKKDKHTKVFEQFYRVNENLQYTFPGLGLGLYISSEIIKSLKGKIWVESAEGKGSVFHFKIPTMAGNLLQK
jgi:K+-sensing histidine kinase KdpD